MEVLDIATVLSVGLLIGVEFSVSAFVNPILAGLDEAGAAATRVFARVLGRVMPVWYAACLAALVAEAALRFRLGSFGLLATACGIWAAVILISVVILVPINNRLAAMDPAEYRGELVLAHLRWDRIHRGRVLLLTVALVCLLHAILS